MINRSAFSYSGSNSMHMIIKTEEGSQLWLGNYDAATNLTLLKNKQIKSVLTAATMLNISYPEHMKINHKTIHALDLPTYKMTQHFDQGFKFIKQGLKKGHLLVHCAAGISRSSTLVIVYLMKAHYIPFRDALNLCKQKRHIVNPNYGFQNELGRLEKSLREKGYYNKSNTLDQNCNQQEIKQQNNGLVNKDHFIKQSEKQQLQNSQMNRQFWSSVGKKTNYYQNKGNKGKFTSQLKHISSNKPRKGSQKLQQNNFFTLKLDINKIKLKK